MLIVSLAVEAGVFWFTAPPWDPSADTMSNLAVKFESATAWTAVGWVSFSLTWLWVELARWPFVNGRRFIGLLSPGEVLLRDAGLHWLVLLRDIRTGKLNDGDEAELNDPLFPKAGERRSRTWYFVWIPIWLALLTVLFFIGWIAWLVRSTPELVSSWCESAKAFVGSSLPSDFAPVVGFSDWLFSMLPNWLRAFAETAHSDATQVFWWLIVARAAIYVLESALSWITGVRFLLRLSRWFLYLSAMFALAATPFFDWVTPVYTYFPNNGPVAMAFFPLNFAGVALAVHVALWSSWRYGIIQVTKSRDAGLIIVGGILNFDKREFHLERIVETRIQQSLWQRLFGIGDLEIVEIGGARGDFFIKHISRPRALDHTIKNAIQQRRDRSVAEE